MWQLMSSLNASTESGQAQIAALLNLTDEASAYYELLESASNRYREAALGIYEVNEAARQVSLNAALTSARMGDMSLAEGLDLSSIAPNQSDFSSLLDFQLAQADTSRKLLELADITEGQLTVEDKQLAELEKIREALSGESKQNTEESMQAMQELKYEIENLSRNTGRIQNEMSEYLEKIANGTIRVRVES
jgi:vacuolar-type H+-ATPase subunit I/STV1